ncbi:MAG TPA: acyltransferase [Thermoanaerobaculia bacterium]|jgi:acetyltransferase-like isoleucine patch superfamily enzyme|nr:acyltransferase [Thermoanaerobaculia bacterium]
MPLRDFRIGAVGEDLYPKYVAELAARLDDPALDRNVVVRDELARLYLGRSVDFDRELADPSLPPGTRTLIAAFDPRNATLEAEYYKEIDLEKWKRVKPLLWLWQMFDHSPAGRNVRLGTQLRYMLAQRVFKKIGTGVRIFHDVEFSFGYNMTVGNGVTIHRNVLIDDRDEVILGNDVSISDYANIYSHSHAVEDIHDVSLKKTVIEDRARITYHSVILAGVHVQKDAIVGSMGVASKPVEAGWIVGGIPAKLIAQKSVKP